MITLGIDLGTSAVRAAWFQSTEPRLLTFPDGAHAVPAVVFMDRGTFRVGGAALSRASTHPTRTIRAIKRLLGRAADEPLVERLREWTTVPLCAADDGKLVLDVDGELWEPETIAAQLFARVIDVAEATTGERPDSAVLCTPHWYSPRQRAALSEAAHRAGLATLQILNEATATALSLVDWESRDRVVAIVDVGAGGCTASIMELGPRRIRLLASAGDPLGGGEDVDRLLVRATWKGLEARHGALSADPSTTEMIRQACEAAKRNLQHMSEVTALIPFLPVAGGITNQEVRLDREGVELLMLDVLARVGAACSAALDDAGLESNDLQGVYAVGAMTHLPMVREAIEKVLGKTASRRLDQDGSVALGAARHAGVLAGMADGIPVQDTLADKLSPLPVSGGAPTMPPASLRTAPPPALLVDEAGSAQEFEDALAGVLAALRAGAVTADYRARRPGATTGKTADVIEEPSDADAAAMTRNAEGLRRIWAHLATMMQTARQYGWDHPHAQVQLGRAFQEVASGLQHDPRSVVWRVGFLGFFHGDHAAWEPELAPWNRIPYDLFASGVRRIQLKPGLTIDELRAFLSVLMRERAIGVGPDDDMAAALWDAKIAHIAYEAVDAFEESDDPAFDDKWAGLSAELETLVHTQTAAGDRIDSYAAAFLDARESAIGAAMDEATALMLRGLLDPGEAEWIERFARGFMRAHAEAERQGDTDRLTSALTQWAQERAQASDAPATSELLDALERAAAADSDPAAAAGLRMQLEAAVYTNEWLNPALAALAPHVHPHPRAVRAFSQALDAQSHDGFFATALEGMGRVQSETLRAALLGYVQRFVEGHEDAIMGLLGSSTADQALTLLGALRDLGTEQAKAAAATALHSPHAAVRFQAIAWLSSESVTLARDAMSALIEDPDADVRQETLTAIAAHGITAAGPILVRRVQSGGYDELPGWERKLLLETVGALHRRRAEELAIAILDSGKLFTSEAATQSRAIAAEFLGESESAEALEALERAAHRRWLNSQGLRAVAARSASSVTRRRTMRPPPPQGSQ